MNAKNFMELRDYLQVIHHVPGRIRVRMNPLLLTNSKALSLVNEELDPDVISNAPGIKKARLNPMLGTLMLEYDAGIIEPGVLDLLFKSQDKDLFTEAFGEIAANLGLFHQNSNDKF